MFFRRKKKTIAEPIQVSVEFMPMEFFGGVNPVVQFKDKTAIVNRAPGDLTTVEKKALDQTTTAGAGKKLHLANLLLNRKFILIGAGVLFAIFAIVASVYYFWPVISSRFQVPVAITPVEKNTVTPDTTVAVVTSTEPLSPPEDAVGYVDPEEIVLEPTFADTKIIFPSVLLSDSADFDRDDITDIAEELFMTDPGVPDSDNDKYEDGHELFNLYDPIREEPMRLIDSGLVTEYVNPVFNYKLYYPRNWAVGNVDENYRDVLFSTLTGENVELRVYDLQPNQSLFDWMAVFAPTEPVQSLVDFSTAFKEDGKRRGDYLVYYFVNNSRIYVLAYHTADSEIVNYRSVIKMIARSFRSGGMEVFDLVPPIIEGAESDIVETATTTTPIAP